MLNGIALPRHAMMDDYLDHCDFALDAYGKYVFSTLSTAGHFCEWVSEQKAKAKDWVDSVVANPCHDQVSHLLQQVRLT